jgi:predicted HTH transcriptional regulator
MKTKASNNANKLQELTGKKLSDKQRILDYLRDYKRISIISCINALQMVHQTASARLSDLHDDGIITQREGETHSYYILSQNPEKVKAQRERIKIDGLIKKLEAYGYEVIKK